MNCHIDKQNVENLYLLYIDIDIDIDVDIPLLY